MTTNAVAPWEGRLFWVGTPNGGRNRNGEEWKSVDFGLVYQDHQMQEQRIVFNIFGVEKVDRLMNIPLGTEIRVTWTPDARESNGKWWPKFNAFGIRVLEDDANSRPNTANTKKRDKDAWKHGTMPDQAPAYRGKPFQPQPNTNENGDDLPW